MKIGDRVKILETCFRGELGRIESKRDISSVWEWNVRIDARIKNGKRVCYQFNEHELELLDCPCNIKNCIAQHKH